MTREIKFRAKRLRTGEWVYGWYVGYSESSGYIHGDYVDKDEVWGVDAQTVGQYTGLKDKNGKEIYEGDLLTCVSELFSNFGKYPTGTFETRVYEVVWHKEGWGKKEIKNDRWTKSWSNFGRVDRILTECCEKYYTVTGNIHDKTNLLKEGHQ